ncbi:hypothetical protein EXT67_20500 [Pectobacterium atrosepticum]|nr:hypothetical protein [Pectobacterium atrosepticum]MCL6318687.1 hypothetical protein [Pectobacterium atrosepticum]
MKINLFRTLNTMQKSLTCYPDQFGSVQKAWELRVKFTLHNPEGPLTRRRGVSFIQKFSDGYLVTRSGITYPTFMAALASLTGEWLSALSDLIRSMCFGCFSDGRDSSVIVNSAVFHAVGQTYTTPEPKEYLPPQTLWKRIAARFLNKSY